MELKVGLFAPLVCLFLAGCAQPKVTAPATNLSPEQLVGSWKLKSVDGASPTTIDVKSYKAEFLKDGAWKFFCEMGGRYAGMQLEGSGKWQIINGSLHCTAGANQNKSKLTIENQILKLSPDPVLLRGGKTPLTTTYQKEKLISAG